MVDPSRRAARLYRELGPVAYRRSLELLGSDADAVEAAREVLARLVADLASLEGPANAVARVHAAATSHAMATLRRRGDARDRTEARPECPSGVEDLALEEVLLGRGNGTLAAHVPECAFCRDRIAAKERLGEQFRALAYPGTVDAVMEAAAAPWSRGWRRQLLVLFPVAGLATLAAVLLLFAPHIATDEMGPTRAPLGLAVYAGAEGYGPVRDGRPVPAGAELRFQVRTRSPCKLWLVAVDATGVTPIYPRSGDGELVEGTVAPPATARLDGKPGPVRIYAICAPGSLSRGAVEAAVGEATDGGERAVRRGGALGGLPAGTLGATVLLEKAP